MNKKGILHFPFSILLITIISCNSLATPIPGTSLQSTQESKSTSTSVSAISTSVSNIQEIDSGANLELRTFLMSSEDVGNGMQRLSIFFDGKNASSQWYIYSLADFTEGDQCLWTLKGGPTLITIEGYSYQPVRDRNSTCGPRAALVPPGVSFSYNGDDFNDMPIWLGWIQFDIPQNATAKEITFPYSVFEKDLKFVSYESVTTFIRPFTEARPITDPIDSKYGLKVYSVGDEINFGSLAKINFQFSPLQSEDKINVTIELTSLDQGYPIEIVDPDTMYNHNYSYSKLLYDDGVICCGLVMDEELVETASWQLDPGNIIGPSQKGTIQADIIMRNGNVWIIFNITIQETVQNGRSENQFFVLQIP